MLCRPDCNASAVCGRAQRLSGRKRRAGVYNVAATVSFSRAEMERAMGIRAMGSCECYVVSCARVTMVLSPERCLRQREGVLRTVAVARACVSQSAMDSFWQVTGAWWQGVVCATVTLPRHWCRLRAVGVLQTEQARAP